MHDSKVRLLMEETNCEQGEAELALELAGNDLEKAIRTIESLLKHIVAFKGKFILPNENLYGLLLVVVDTKAGGILRLHSVVSYNPSLFENSLSMDWYAFEKQIFTYRLDEGSLPEFTRGNEQKLREFLESRKDVLVSGDIGAVSGLFADFFKQFNVTANIEAEELNLAQFRQLTATEASSAARATGERPESSIVVLRVEFLQDKNGKEAEKISEGEVVLSKITDDRDIAHYLAHLIGGKKEDGMIPLPSSIRKVTSGPDGFEVQVYLAPGVAGIGKVSADSRIKVIEMRSDPWWKKIIPW